VKLVQPFEESLARKRELMDETLRELEKLVDYEVAEVTAASTFYMAEVYYNFARALLDSERPTGLDAAELVEYEEVIEEEAFPFEELAIEVHEKNLELTNAGVYNRWIEDSVDRLADLMPGRYAKEEESFGFLGSLESFTYVSPAVAALAEAGAYAAQPVETSGHAGRRTRGGTQKGSTAHLEVTEGSGFAITEQARIGAEVRTEYESALRYLEQGLYESGITALVQVTERAPELASPYIELGIAYGRAGDLERAGASLVKALELSAAHPVALNELGLIYRRQGRFALARESYEKSLAAYADLHFARKNLAILCDLYLRDLVCALENFEAYSALVPEDAQAAIWIADIRSRLNP
jgi:tetratricopeptide (TPR) repeat protein